MKLKRLTKMGNVLCKNKGNQTQSGKSSFDGIIGRCTQLCPHSIGKKKHFWDKQVLETSPPCSQQPKMDDSGWKTVSLTVPDGPQTRPIPPPRKKRHSSPTRSETISIKDDSVETKKPTETNDEIKIHEVIEIKTITEPEKIEEKIILEKTESSELKIDKSIESPKLRGEALKPTTTEQTVELKGENDDNKPAVLTRNVSKVGNKKSDKFFGENLSESLSDEPMTSAPEANEKSKELVESRNDEETLKPKDNEKHETKEPSDRKLVLEDKVQVEESRDETDKSENIKIENVDDSEEMTFQINKEKGNILFAIQNQFPDKEVEDDPNRIPVEEEVIVPKKRVTHHICDSDDLIHNMLHKSPIPDGAPPKKPQRDFSKYRKSLETLKSNESTEPSHTIEDSGHAHHIEEKTNKLVVSTSEEDIISDAETLPIEEASPEKRTPPLRPPKLRTHRSSDITPPNLTRSEKILRRCLSSQSYLTTDLIEAIAQQANNLSMSSDDYFPEDTISSNDGSSHFSPSSKLTERKRKTSQNSIEESKQTKSLIEPKVTINGQISVAPDKEEKKSEEILKLNSKDKEEYLPNYEEATGIPRLPLEVEITTITSSQTSSVPEESKKHLSIDPNFHRKVSSTKEISDAIKTFLSKDDLNPKQMLKLLEDEFGDLLNSSCLSAEDQKIIQKLKDSVQEEDKLVSKMKSSLEHENEIKHLTPIESSHLNESQKKPVALNDQLDLKSPGIINKALEAVMTGEKRRHSIDDLNSWFLSDSPKDENTNEHHNYEIKHRKREISLPNSLDVVATETITLIKDNNEQYKQDKNKSEKIFHSKNDHSPLLKFLEHEKSTYD